MKKLFVYSLAIAFLSMVMIGCGEKKSKEKLSIKPEKTKIQGDLRDYYEVVDHEYVFKTGDGLSKLIIELKRTNTLLPDTFKNAKVSSIYDYDDQTDLILGISSELLDENNGIIFKTEEASEDSEMKSLFALAEGETASITLLVEDEFWIDGTWDRASKFRVNTYIQENDEKESEETSSFELSNVLLPSQLKGKVEVINAEKSVGSYGYPSMEITFKLLSTVNTSSMCSEYGQMWIVGVGQTENGVDVKELLPNYREWRSGDSHGNEFKEFLESEPDETITLEFTGSKESSNDVESDLEKVKKFKLKITN